MSLLVDILGTITVPLVLLIALGYALEWKLRIGPTPLARLFINGIVPCALFHFLSTAKLPLGALWFTALFTVLQFAAFAALGYGLAVLLRLPPAMRAIFALCVAFPNSGNFGIPMVELALGPDWILHQSIVMACHTVLIVVSSVLLLMDRRPTVGHVLRESFRTPMLPAIAAGLLVKALDLQLPAPLASPFAVIAGALTPLALITLGVQLASAKVQLVRMPVFVVVAVCLIVTPLLTWGALELLQAGGAGLEPGLVDLLVLGACTPVGLLLVLLVAERGGDASFPAAVVVLSTILGPLAVTAAIYLLRA